MVTANSSFPNIDKDGESTSLSNFSFDVNVNKICGDSIDFNLHISSSEKPSGWDVPLTLNIGDEPPETITLIDEDFNFGMPSSWEIVDGGYNDDADPSVWTWTDQNPCSGGTNTFRHIDPPVSEPFMIVDSDCAGPDAILDEQLKLPIMDFTMADSAFLEFDQHFAMISETEVCYVDVISSLTDNQWLNIWEQHGLSPDFNPIGGRIEIDISQYAVGASNVQLRFRYYDAEYGWWWVIDNVKVYYAPSTSCTMDRCCPSMTTPQLTITDDNLCAQRGLRLPLLLQLQRQGRLLC